MSNLAQTPVLGQTAVLGPIDLSSYNTTLVTLIKWIIDTLLPIAREKKLITDDIQEKIDSFMVDYDAARGMIHANNQTDVAHTQVQARLVPFKRQILARDESLIRKGQLPLDEALRVVMEQTYAFVTREQIAYIFSAMTDLLWFGGSLTQAEWDMIKNPVSETKEEPRTFTDQELSQAMQECPQVFQDLKDNLSRLSQKSNTGEVELSLEKFATQITSNPKLAHLLELSEAAASEEAKEDEFKDARFEQVYVVFNQSVTKALQALVESRGQFFPRLIQAQSDFQQFMRKDGTTKRPLEVFTTYEDAFLKMFPEYKDTDSAELLQDETYGGRVLTFATFKVDLLATYGINEVLQKTFPKAEDKKSLLGYVDNMRQCASSSRWASKDMGAVGQIVNSVIRATGLKPGQQVTPQQLNIGNVMMTTMNTFANDEHQAAMIHTLRQFKDKKKRDAIRRLIGAVAPQYSGMLNQLSQRMDKSS
jgi:hypothetical protein